MSSLRKQKQRETQHDESRQIERGAVVWTKYHDAPVQAVDLDGNAIVVTHIGDVPGRSPVFLVNNSEGLTDVMSVLDVQFTQVGFKADETQGNRAARQRQQEREEATQNR